MKIQIKSVLITTLISIHIYKSTSSSSSSISKITFPINQNKIHTKTCSSDSDCLELNTCTNKICIHDGLFPLFLKSIIGMLLLTVGLLLSTSVGMGGGGLILPILILVMNFYSHQAIPLSKSIVFCNTLISFFMHVRQKDSINYNLALLCLPSILIGSTIGVKINNLIHGVFLITILSFCLIIISGRIVYKAFKSFIDYKSNKISHSNENIVMNSSYEQQIDIEIKEDEDRNRIFPISKVLYVLIPYSIFLLYILLSMSDYGKSLLNIPTCIYSSSNYWFLFILYLFIMITLIFIISYRLYNQYNRKLAFKNSSSLSKDISYTKKNILIFTFSSIFIGFISGSVGLGGGVVLSPLLFEYGLDPIIATHTSNFIVMFISSSSLIQFYFLGLVIVDYAFFIWVLPIISTILSVLLINSLIKKLKSDFPILFIMSFILLIACFSMLFYSIQRILSVNSLSEFFGLYGFCE